MPTGDVEVQIDRLEILNAAETPPFPIEDGITTDEMVRLKYRYLDLRRPEMQQRMFLRAKVIKLIRDYMDAQGFVEVETPILIKSTPEGARDYLVPARLYPGHFYALPQSPQQLKQLLMVSGFDRYYQIAKCFRDEDPRADRQPEFTQLDLEMSFVKQEDIFDLCDPLFESIVEQLSDKKLLTKPFPRMSYAEAMERYGIDKPDIRFGMELFDITDIANATEFKVFQSAKQVKGICAQGCAGYSRGQIDDITELAKKFGAKGLVTIALTEDGVKSPDCQVPQGRGDEGHHRARGREDRRPADDRGRYAEAGRSIAWQTCATRWARRLGLRDDSVLAFAWVTDFPLFKWDEDGKRWDAEHHPFTMPHEERFRAARYRSGQGAVAGL